MLFLTQLSGGTGSDRHYSARSTCAPAGFTRVSPPDALAQRPHGHLLQVSIVHTMLNFGDFQGLEHDKDPIAGDHDGTCSMTIQHKPIKKTLHGLPRFTTVKGGAYVLLPGPRALRSLGNA